MSKSTTEARAEKYIAEHGWPSRDRAVAWLVDACAVECQKMASVVRALRLCAEMNATREDGTERERTQWGAAAALLLSVDVPTPDETETRLTRACAAERERCQRIAREHSEWGREIADLFDVDHGPPHAP